MNGKRFDRFLYYNRRRLENQEKRFKKRKHCKKPVAFFVSRRREARLRNSRGKTEGVTVGNVKVIKRIFVFKTTTLRRRFRRALQVITLLRIDVKLSGSKFSEKSVLMHFLNAETSCERCFFVVGHWKFPPPLKMLYGKC